MARPIAAVCLIAALAGCTAVQHRHVVQSEPLADPQTAVPGRVIEDFDGEGAEQLWTLYEVEGSVNPLARQRVDGALHLRSDASAGLVWRQVGFDPRREPLLTWRWKVSRTFDTSSPLSPELDNFPARVLVGFDSGWDGANPAALVWRRKVEQYTGVTPPARAICYTFGGELPSVQAVDATFGDGRIAVINLRTPRAEAGRWYNEVRDVASDYTAVFREPPPPVTAFALGCDTHRLKIVAEAWFDDLTVYGHDAYPHFRARLAPVPERTIPLLTWLIMGGSTIFAAGTAGVWLWLRRRDRVAGL
jgi:hypothetical protein